MNKELQDLAWSVLPKEFKEEVKKRYKTACRHCDLYSARGTMETLELLFGKHNLTSDAEGEEMLTVPRSKVQELYRDYCAERDNEEPESHRSSLGGRIAMLQELFGSKCLTDEPASKEPKLAEPTVFSIESDKVSVLNYALLKLEEASKAVREALTKIN